MKIELWSDFACPFCYAGKKRFERALNEFGHPGEIQVNYRSFQLNPDKKNGSNTDVVSELADSYRVTREKALEMIQNAVAFVESEGLIYDYENMISTNTRDAHRLNYFAKKFGKDKEMSDRLFLAHFAEGLDIGNRDILSDLAQEINLDREDAFAMLNSEQYSTEINQDIQDAIKLKIDLVPTFIFNDKTRISGALVLKDFLEALKKV